MHTLLCKACQKEFEYNPKEYGGVCNESEYQGSLCKGCWDENAAINILRGEALPSGVNV